MINSFRLLPPAKRLTVFSFTAARGGREKGGRCYRTSVCSKGEMRGRKINTASQIFTPVREASGKDGCVCTCASVYTCLWVPPCLPSQNESRSVERYHNPGSGGRVRGTGQPGRAEAGAQACPWGQAKASFQNRGARPGPISHGLGVWGRGLEGQPQIGRSVPGEEVG